MISCQKLNKNFRIYQKEAGLKGSLRAFFSRKYIDKVAVHDFNLEIEKGEFIGLLGPNGAGKTTLMKMFTGIIEPSHGEVIVAGHRPADRKVEFRKSIALVMGQKSQLWWDITAHDAFLLLQRYYEIDEKRFRNRIGLLTEVLNVKHVLSTHIRKLSLGERMKLELIACLLHDPKVIFLDEPTIGLDLVAQRNIRSFLKSYQNEYKTTIVLTSHYMADVQELCQRLILILGGSKRFDDSIQAFSRVLGDDKNVTLTFAKEIDKNDKFFAEFSPSWLEDRRGVSIQVPVEKLVEVGKYVFATYPVLDFSSEAMPIERVMETLMNNPHLTKEIL
ncbi:MAG: ATP-binding cassette domain-containing protein [Oligoflexales bacterium]|nr:ATP-binding cassette domain-containing protein [Oligoflexales bacterium]